MQFSSMSKFNRLITLNLILQWLRANAAAVGWLLLIGVPISVHFLNADTSETIVDAIVLFSVNAPDRRSATDNHLLAKLQDGKTIEMYLPQGWAPPPTGKTIRVKRIQRLFFGERFVLLKQ